MKKLYLFALAFGIPLAATAADDYVTPYVWEQVFAQRVSHNGLYVLSQDLVGNAYVLNMQTKVMDTYAEVYLGDGACLTDAGTAVGQDISTSKGVIMRNGEVSVPQALSSYTLSQINAITNDESRIAGWVSNPTGGFPLYLPFVADVSPAGVVSKPTVLPYPKTDLFGQPTQGVPALCISDDGKTISGFVTNDSGMYSWPIVFREEADGKWTYSQPSEVLFNPDHLPMPEAPVDGSGPERPDPKDFMTAEEYNLWQEAKAEDPNIQAYLFMSDEEYADWEKAISDWNKAYNEYLEQFDRYYEELYAMGSDNMFGGFMSLSSDGQYLLTSKLVMPDGEFSTAPAGYVPFEFNLSDGKFGAISTKYADVLPTQMLPDGTIIAVSSPAAFVPYVGYVRLPGADEFLTVSEFFENKFPAYLPWIEDNFLQFGTVGYDENGEPIKDWYTISGFPSVSDDFTTIVGGLPIGEMMSYVYYDPTLGVEDIAAETEDTGFTVYNLTGIRVLVTGDKAAVEALPAGIYVVNGKKLVIK